MEASNLVGSACVSESELDFDPATQAELVVHSLLPGVHHPPTVDTTYTISCTGPGGNAEDAVFVRVDSSPGDPPPAVISSE